jgi:cytochrome c peroxidase
MHNGGLETLEAVVAFYNQGGGKDPNKSPLLKPLGLSEQEQADLVAFLHALTGQQRKMSFE